MNTDAIQESTVSAVVQIDSKIKPGISKQSMTVTSKGMTEGQSGALKTPEIILRMTLEERNHAERLLIRKIDLRLLPMIILMYIMNYLDRNNIAAARIAGMEDELGLSSVQYLTAVSILFVGHVLFQVPSNVFLNKMGKPALYLPTAVAIWGAISAATSAAQSFPGLAVCRFFLGATEAAFFPGAVFYLSCWYTRKELGFRTALLFSGLFLSGAFSGLIAAGITGNMDGVRGLRAWRWLFIIEGSATIVIAISAYFILPNFPRTTSWLTEEERQLAIWRLVEDIGEDDWVNSKQQSLLHGMKLAFTDVKIYIFTIMVWGTTVAGGVTYLFPTIVQTLGYSKVTTLLLTAPPYILCVISTLINAWHADRTDERYWHVSLPFWGCIVAFIIAATTTSVGPRYFAMMMMVPCIYTGHVVTLAWISNTIPRPPAKRAVALAAISAMANTASIWTSYLYPTSDGPRYVKAMAFNSAAAFIVVCAATVLRFVLVGLNKKLEDGIHVEGAVNSTNTVDNGAVKSGFRYKV